MTAVRLAITILGTEVFAISTDAVVEYDDPGDCTTYPVGFVATHEIPDQAGPYREGWE